MLGDIIAGLDLAEANHRAIAELEPELLGLEPREHTLMVHTLWCHYNELASIRAELAAAAEAEPSGVA
jgi:hypothetical protein